MLVISWNAANIEHIGKHGVRREEAVYVLRNARSPWPEARPDDKFLVWGQTQAGRYLQVIFLFPPDEQIDIETLSAPDLLAFSEGDAEVAYVIHAMELDAARKRQYLKRRH